MQKSGFKVSVVILLVLILIVNLAWYGHYVEVSDAMVHKNETITIPFQTGTTTEYRTYTKDELIQVLSDKLIQSYNIRVQDAVK